MIIMTIESRSEGSGNDSTGVSRVRGILELAFDGVCGPRSETLVPFLKMFLSPKRLI